MPKESELAPVPEEVSALTVLQGQVQALTTQLQTLTSERDEYRDALTEVSAERDSLKTAPEAASRIAELEASIRDRNHYDKFAELAGVAKAKPKALKQLWRDAKDRGYKLESDDVDAKALQAAVDSLKTEIDYAFDPDETAASRAAQEAAAAVRTTSRTKYGLEMRGEQAAGGGRQERNQGTDGTIVTQEMRADPKFMLDPRNKELIRDAALGGRFR
jgi:chromosome segregation ATPase